MDQQKIGRFIKELRIQKNMSQKELADILNITPQAISKWENGRGIPDIEILKQISEEFNVEIKDLLNGERTVKVRKNNYLLIAIILILLFLIFTKNTNVDIKKINSKENDFKIMGMIAMEKNKSVIYISNVLYKDLDEEEYINISVDLIEQDKKKYEIMATYKKEQIENETFSLKELLENVELETIYSCNNISSHELYLVINATTKEKKVLAYKIPLEIEKKCSK